MRHAPSRLQNKVLDINCDMGESFGNWKAGDDAAVIARITTANYACGFHASDPITMMRTWESCSWRASGPADLLALAASHGRLGRRDFTHTSPIVAALQVFCVARSHFETLKLTAPCFI